MMLYMWAMFQADPMSSSWEVAKGVMLTLTTMGVTWIARTVFLMRDEVVLLRKCVGMDGKNGLISEGKAHDTRIDDLEHWKTEVHAVEAADRMRYEGENKRHTRRRALDKLRDEGEGAED